MSTNGRSKQRVEIYGEGRVLRRRKGGGRRRKLLSLGKLGQCGPYGVVTLTVSLNAMSIFPMHFLSHQTA